MKTDRIKLFFIQVTKKLHQTAELEQSKIRSRSQRREKIIWNSESGQSKAMLYFFDSHFYPNLPSTHEKNLRTFRKFTVTNKWYTCIIICKFFRKTCEWLCKDIFPSFSHFIFQILHFTLILNKHFCGQERCALIEH